MNLDTLITRLKIIRSNNGNMDVMYLVSVDTEQYPVDSVDVVKSDEAIEEKLGFRVGTKYVLIKSDLAL